MSAADRAAFLAAIRDNPEDDLPRLVYADWLDEHGEPERAEFIRVQIVIAGLADDDPRRPELTARQDELWMAHAQSWRPPPSRGIIIGQPERGFICYTGASNFYAFAAVAESLFDTNPIHQVAIPRMRPKHLRTLAQMPQLAYVTHLDMPGGTISNAAVISFAQSPYLGRIHDLRLDRNRIGDAGAQALMESPGLANLRVLSLSENLIGDVGAEAFAAAPHWHALAKLDLRHNLLGRDACNLLRARYGSAVKL